MRAERDGTVRRKAAAALCLLCAALWSRPAQTAEPLTLEQVLERARAANAALPVAAAERAIAAERVREAEAALWPTLSAEGSGGYQAPTSAFAASSSLVASLQLVFRESLYEGGSLRAQLGIARARFAASGAGYRIAEADLDFMVRSQFSELVAAEAEMEVRRRGIERLDQYLRVLEARQAAGQGLMRDLLKAKARLGSQRAEVVAAQQRADEARLALNELMGREPVAPLAVVAPPPPRPDPAFGPAQGEAWLSTPDLAQARSEYRAALLGIADSKAGRRPHLSLTALGGLVEYAPEELGSVGDNLTDGLGGAVVLSLSWPLWDLGLYRARVRAAEFESKRAYWNTIDVLRTVRLRYQTAATQLDALGRQMAVWRQTVPTARDAYLAAESAFRGGSGTALDVLDAFDAWISASTSLVGAVQRYRVAEAGTLRWGGAP